jgi:hypothetical protein
MQYPNDTHYDSLHVWLAVAVVGFLLGAAALALCDTCETRDLTRQGFFLMQTRVL